MTDDCSLKAHPDISYLVRSKSSTRMRTLHFFAIAGLAVTLLFSSCAVTTTMHFNKDYSGSYTTEVDMSELIGMSAMFDTTGTMDQAKMVGEMRHAMDSMNLAGLYNEMSGIHNAKIDVSDEGVISIGFSFDNLAALEASFKTMQDRAAQETDGMDAGGMDMLPTDLFSGGIQTFRQSGKTLTHTYRVSEDTEGLMGDSGDDMDMISAMVDYTLVFSFDKKIKRSDADGMTVLEQDAKMLKMRVDADRLIGGQYSISIVTK